MALDWLVGLATAAAKTGYDKAASWHENNKRKHTKRKIQEHKEKALQKLESNILHCIGDKYKSTQKYLNELDHYIKQKDDFINKKKKEIEKLTSKTHRAEKIARYALWACTLAALLLATLAYIKH